MADKKITELAVATAPTGAELIEIVQGGVNKQTTLQDVADLAAGGVTSVNGQTGVVVLDAGDVGADPAGSASTVATNLSNHISDTSDAHDASAISFAAAGNIAATDVQSAIEVLGNANIDRASSALTDSSTIAITGTKHTLTSAEAAVTWSYTFTGEEMKVLITLNLDAADYTFPSGTLCIVDGDATGDNTAPLFGISGDKYLLVITKFESAYVAVVKNIGQ